MGWWAAWLEIGGEIRGKEAPSFSAEKAAKRLSSV
jgi:hypothetical protein